MTAYEIADLRNQISTRISFLLSAILSLTLAVFAAAFTAGTRLDTSSVVALILFYVMAMAFTLPTLNIAYAQLVALAESADKLEEVEGERPAVLQKRLVLPAPGSAFTYKAAALPLVLGFIWYVLKVSGHFS